MDKGVKLKGELKFKKVENSIFEVDEIEKKPDWIRVKVMSYSQNYKDVKNALRSHSLHTVCEEASCPNIGECFHNGTASFMIMGDICTRRCGFCDVGFGRPNALDPDEPENLAKAIKDMKLKYAVITSVDRDDLADGGASHFVECIKWIRNLSPETKIEILTPDFRGRLGKALEILSKNLPDVFNHNLETIERLYKTSRSGANLENSLQLLLAMKEQTGVITKSGVMVGLGETDEEIMELMAQIREYKVDMLTIGQYLQPTKFHLPVKRYVHPEQFKKYEEYGKKLGFKAVASGAMVRSSYYADNQFYG